MMQFVDINPEANLSEDDYGDLHEIIHFESENENDPNIEECRRLNRFDPSSFNTPRGKTKRQMRFADKDFRCLRKSIEKSDRFSSNFSKNLSNRKTGAHADFIENMLQAPKKPKFWKSISILGTHGHCFDELSQDRLTRAKRAREVNIDELTISQIRNSSTSSPSRFNDLSCSRPLNIFSNLSVRHAANKSMERTFDEK